MTELDQSRQTDPVYGLLPWYATGQLGDAERLEVEAALAADPALRQSLDRVIEERDEAVALNEAVPGMAGGSIDALMSRIEADAPRRDRSTTPGLVARLLEMVAGLSPRVLALAAVAAALVIIAESGALVGLAGRGVDSGTKYVTASAEPIAGDQSILLVAFVPGVSLDEVSALLRVEQVTIVDGPKAGGLFRVSVAAGREEAVLADLKTHTDLVRFVGPGK